MDTFEERELQYELDKEKCFVCRFQLSFEDKEPERLKITCPCCQSVNVLTQSGKTNTPERLALYRKYDGDLYDKKLESLSAFTERQSELRLRMFKEMKQTGGLSSYEYEAHEKDLEIEKAKRLVEIQREKETELEIIRKRERELRKNSPSNDLGDLN